MRKLPLIAFAGAAGLALAGTAVAASRNGHVMNVALPDGSVARVEYVGDVAPKVVVLPTAGPVADWGPLAFPSFAGLDRMIAQMNLETEAMMRQAQQLARLPVGAGAVPYVAAFGNAPAGMTSTTVVSYSNGSGTCTRTTETVSQGPGKAPLVKSSVTGNCGASAAPIEPRASSAPINRT